MALQTEGRVQELQGRLAERGLDGAVFRLAENVVLLTGYYLQIGGLPAVVVPADHRRAPRDQDRCRHRASGFRWEDDAEVGAEGARELATSEYGLD